jgi:hypothetical protein
MLRFSNDLLRANIDVEDSLSSLNKGRPVRAIIFFIQEDIKMSHMKDGEFRLRADNFISKRETNKDAYGAPRR